MATPAAPNMIEAEQYFSADNSMARRMNRPRQTRPVPPEDLKVSNTALKSGLQNLLRLIRSGESGKYGAAGTLSYFCQTASQRADLGRMNGQTAERTGTGDL